MGACALLRRCVVAASLLLAASPASATAPTETPTIDPATALTGVRGLLDRLVVAPERHGERYERSAFRHWVDADGDCQDTRVEVLAREDLSGPSDGCRVVSGRWVSWLDGRTFTSSRGLDVDHLVALAEAWSSGAHAWSPSRREAFANDLGYEWSLRAVSAASNRSKSDRDPAQWLPAAPVRCDYVSRWVAVKYRWGLSVDPAERAAIVGVLDAGGCAVAAFPVPPLAPGTPGAPGASSVPPAAPEARGTTVVPADPSSGRAVTPGAFCAPAGATGTSSSGKVYVCTSSTTDGRNRWRRGRSGPPTVQPARIGRIQPMSSDHFTSP